MTHYQLVKKNKQKSFLVIFFFILFIFISAYLMMYGLGYGFDILGIALIISGAMSFASYWYSDKIILSISQARSVTKAKYFDLYTVTENLAHSRKLPTPKIYVIQDTAMNAFATGRDPEHAVICVTSGLVAKLTRAELEGVIAHELSHIQNYDIRLMSIVTILVGFIALLSDWMLRMTFRGKKRSRKGGELQLIIFIAGISMAVLSPIIAKLIQLTISRKREFLADASAVSMTKNPSGLIKALKKISQDKEPLEVANKATAHLYISNPLKNTSNLMFAKLFRTHPPIKERISSLKKLI